MPLEVDPSLNLTTVDKTEYWLTNEICKDEKAALNLLYQQPQVAANVKDTAKGSPLVVALESRASNAVCLKLLLYNPDAVAIITRGALPLHLAMKLGTDEAIVAKMLGIHPHGARQEDKDEFLPLHLALRQPLVADSVVAMLVETYPYSEVRRCPRGPTGRPPAPCFARAMLFFALARRGPDVCTVRTRARRCRSWS